MKYKNKYFEIMSLISFLFILDTSFAHADVSIETDSYFRTTLTANAPSRNLKSDYNATGQGEFDDSSKLQTAIDELSASGGGRIMIPAGFYKFSNIKLKSHIHIEIASGAVISPHINNDNKAVKIFIFSDQIEDVSVVGYGGSFLVELPIYSPGIFVFQLSSVRNFKIAHVRIKDQLSKFSAISLAPEPQKILGPTWPQPPSKLKLSLTAPTYGVIEDIEQTGAHVGYGVVQLQAGQHILLRKLTGEGGVALRLETGLGSMNDAQEGGIDDIVAREISCRDGFAAVMLQPHSMHNGSVDIDGVNSKGCQFAVTLRPGFISRKQRNPHIGIGSFNTVSIKNIMAYFGNNAQIPDRPQDIGLVRPSDRSFLYLGDDSKSQPGYNIYRGPSIAAVLLQAKGYANSVHLEHVSMYGFPAVPSTISVTDSAKNPSKKRNLK